MDWAKQKAELVAEHAKAIDQAAKLSQLALRLEGAIAMCDKALTEIDAPATSGVEDTKE